MPTKPPDSVPQIDADCFAVEVVQSGDLNSSIPAYHIPLQTVQETSPLAGTIAVRSDVFEDEPAEIDAVGIRSRLREFAGESLTLRLPMEGHRQLPDIRFIQRVVAS